MFTLSSFEPEVARYFFGTLARPTTCFGFTEEPARFQHAVRVVLGQARPLVPAGGRGGES